MNTRPDEIQVLQLATLLQTVRVPGPGLELSLSIAGTKVNPDLNPSTLPSLPLSLSLSRFKGS